MHVWDLSAIRVHLAAVGLDWDAPAYSEDDPAHPLLPPSPPLKVDYGPVPLTGQIEPKFYEFLIAGLEAALAHKPDERRLRGMLASYCKNYAWGLANGPESSRDPQRALTQARRAIQLDPKEAIILNTLGVVLYYAGRYAAAIGTSKRSRAANRGQFEGLDSFFLAMAHHLLGHRQDARARYDRAVRWVSKQKSLPEQYVTDLAAFRAEAVLGGTGAELPADVLAPPR